MKRKILMILSALSISLSCLAQQEGLMTDKPGKDGSRFIGTYYHYMSSGFTDTNPVGLSIYSDINKKRILYFLSVRMSNVTYPKGGIMLIKTSEGEIIELKQIQNDYDTESSHYIPNVGVVKKGTGFYPITVEELNTINQDGIAKVRIETSGQVIDREYKEKQIERYKKEFSSMFSLILKSISEKKDIYTDF
jgi:hypothetical protein